MTEHQYLLMKALRKIGPASCDRLSKVTGLDSTKCSDVCRQLVKRKNVAVVGGNAMRRLYQAR